MSAYANYSGGAQSYTYRRRTSMERGKPGVQAEPRVHAEPGEGNTDTRRARLHARHLSAALVHAGRARPHFSHDEITRHRRLASAVESDWRNRMVFYDGDERAFYP